MQVSTSIASEKEPFKKTSKIVNAKFLIEINMFSRPQSKVFHSAILTNLICLAFFQVLSSVIPKATCGKVVAEASHAFSKHELHYLNVNKVGTFTVHDVFDCTFKCLQAASCVAINLAACEGPDGKLWCEVLPSDKYGNPTNYKGNDSSHHYSMKTPCSSTPCQNGGTCLANYKDDTFECHCQEGFLGEYCEIAAKSCKELYDANKFNVTQLQTLRFDPAPTFVLCHIADFGCGDGPWTPVMKINGSKTTFNYSSGYWTDTNGYNLPGGETGFDSQETKLPSYWKTPFSKICLGMKIGQQTNFIVINKQANSLYSLIADGQHRATSLGRNTWKSLLGSQGSLQYNCNREGFNSGCSNTCKSRIGIVTNNEADGCGSCDSRLGFGTAGHPDDTNTCGNAARHHADNGERYIKVMGYILVQ